MTRMVEDEKYLCVLCFTVGTWMENFEVDTKYELTKPESTGADA